MRTTSFPIWIPFISFSSLIAVVGLPKLHWIIVVKVNTLVPDLRGNVFSFSPLRIIITVGYHIWPLLCGGRLLLCTFFEEV